MKLRVVLSASAMIPLIAAAQYTNDPSNPLRIGNASNEQVQAKVRIAPDGSAYVSWFDNSAGGYDVYLQHLDADGNELWAHNGILIANRNFSSTTDYGLAVGRDGNAYITYNDDSLGGNDMTIQKVSPAGALLWGAGVHIASGSPGNPKVAVLDDGSVVGGYSVSNTFVLKKLDSNGNILGTTRTEVETGHALTLDDIQPGIGGTVLALWNRGFTTSFLSSKWLYCQKYDSALTPQWNSGNPVQMYAPTGSPYGSQGGSVQNGYFPTIQPDEVGGFYCAWYENAGPRLAYIQHVDAQGHKLMGSVGAPLAIRPTTRMEVDSTMAVNMWTLDAFGSAVQSDIAVQGNYSVISQHLDATGNRLWGDFGVTSMPVNGFQKSFTRASLNPRGMNTFGFDATGSLTGVLYANGYDSVANEIFGTTTPNYVCNITSGKARLDVAFANSGDTISAWSDGATGSSDLCVAKVQSFGSLGNASTVVSGRITPSDFGNYLPDVLYSVRILAGESTEDHLIRTDPDGNFRFRTDLGGTVSIRVSGPHWLAKIVDNVELGVDSPEFVLTNADSDGDNEVGPSDFGNLSTAYGSVPGDANWSRLCDFDGDNEVGPSDFGILSSNYGQTGD